MPFGLKHLSFLYGTCLKDSFWPFFCCLNKSFPPACWWRSFRESTSMEFGRIDSFEENVFPNWASCHQVRAASSSPSACIYSFFSSNIHELPRHGIEFIYILEFLWNITFYSSLWLQCALEHVPFLSLYKISFLLCSRQIHFDVYFIFIIFSYFSSTFN